MQKVLLRFSGLMIIAALFTLSSCEDDNGDGGIINPLEPFIEFNSRGGAITNDATVEPGSTFRVDMSWTPGDNDLASFDIQEDNNLVPTNRLVYNNGFSTTSNPFGITGNDVNGVGQFVVDITAPTAPGVYTYDFNLTDVVGVTFTASLDITVEEPTTPIDATFTMVLLNNADGPDNGGLDLFNGRNVPSGSADADILDAGIDTDLPAAQNWKQAILANSGGRTLRFVDPSTDGADFDMIDTKEAVVALYGAGDTISGESDPVEEGDIFAVRTGGSNGRDYFLLQCTEVFVDPNANGDYLVFSIKQALNFQ